MSHDAIQARESKGPLREIRVSEQVIHSCFRHAFTTEKEEVMGLLLGRIETRFFPPLAVPSNSTNMYGSVSGLGDGVAVGGPEASSAAPVTPAPLAPVAASAAGQTSDWVEGKVALIWATHVSERNVQRSDRVEMSPESLASAAETAERVSADTGVHTHVLGWYHSHPKIPVVPSAVDLNTQRAFQQHVESGWVGLIVSLFNTEANLNRSHCALHGFQAGPSNEHVQVPVHVVSQAEFFPSAEPLKALCDSAPELLRVLRQEVCNGVAAVQERTASNSAASRAARGLAEAQLYEVDRLIAEPTRKELESCSLPFLRAEVARLEKKLAEKSASAGPQAA